MRVLVCGGRDFTDWRACWNALAEAHAEAPITLLIHGGAKGADRLAAKWADGMRIPMKEFPAHWVQHGRAAGPIRNQRMIDEGKPDLVIAMQGGRGTEDMVRRATLANVRVTHVLSRPTLEED